MTEEEVEAIRRHKIKLTIRCLLIVIGLVGVAFLISILAQFLLLQYWPDVVIAKKSW